MLKRVVITNHLGESVEYTIEGVQVEGNQSGLLITSIEGLGPGKATVNMTEIPTSDGGIVNSVRLSGKNIVINGLFLGVSSIEDARILSYKMFPIKQNITITIETDNRTATIDGYVESNEPVIFSKGCGCQISVMCEKAYFNGGAVEYEINGSGVIVFDGDTNDGIIMEFSIPEGSNVTEIEVSKDDEGSMNLSIPKMSNLVPNSSPDELPISQCTFMVSSNRVKYVGALPEGVGSGVGNQFLFNGEWHYIYFDSSGSETVCRHLKWNSTRLAWDELVNITRSTAYGDGSGKIFVYNGDIYCLFNDGDFPIHKLNTNTNAWEEVVNSTRQVHDSTSGGIVIINYNDVAHIFRTEYTLESDGGGTLSIEVTYNYHFTFNGTTLTLVENYSNISGAPFECGSNGYNFSSSNGAVIHNNKIYIFKELTANTWFTPVRYQTDLRIWNGSNWSYITPRSPLDLTIIGGIVEFSGDIHLFESTSGSGIIADPSTKHYILDESEPQWVLTTPSDFGFMYAGAPPVADDSYIYIAGMGQLDSDTYTEDPNNAKLVEDDVLIISTIKGRKRITLYRRGDYYNVVNVLGKNPTWFKLNRGNNTFSYSADDTTSLVITASKLYEGV